MRVLDHNKKLLRLGFFIFCSRKYFSGAEFSKISRYLHDSDMMRNPAKSKSFWTKNRGISRKLTGKYEKTSFFKKKQNNFIYISSKRVSMPNSMVLGVWGVTFAQHFVIFGCEYLFVRELLILCLTIIMREHVHLQMENFWLPVSDSGCATISCARAYWMYNVTLLYNHVAHM